MIANVGSPDYGVSPQLLGFHDNDRDGGDSEAEDLKDKEEELIKVAETDDESEEAMDSIGATVPVKPNKEEVDKHMRTHLPFRSWCKACVEGTQQVHEGV